MKHFLLILFGVIYLNANSSNVSGIDCSLNKFYYVIGRDVFCSDIYSKDVKWSRSLDKDTLIQYNLVNTLKKSLRIKDDSLVRTLRGNVKKFKVINLTCYNNQVFIGIRFKTEASSNSKVKFAILEFDSMLNFKNLFYFDIHHPFKFFTLPPSLPFNFTSNSTMVLPIYKDTGLSFYSFLLDKKNSKAKPLTELSHVNLLKNFMALDNGTGLVLEPLVYNVKNSINWFFQFPIPVLKSTENIIIDPYHKKGYLDSFNRKTNRLQSSSFISTLSLNYADASSKENAVIHSSIYCNDSLYMLAISDKKLVLNKIHKSRIGTNKIVLCEYSDECHYILKENFVLCVKIIGSEAESILIKI